MLSEIIECLIILAAVLLVSMCASPKALRNVAAWLLAQACMAEYIYEELKALANRAAYLRREELAFYRDRLELDVKPRRRRNRRQEDYA